MKKCRNSGVWDSVITSSFSIVVILGVIPEDRSREQLIEIDNGGFCSFYRVYDVETCLLFDHVSEDWLMLKNYVVYTLSQSFVVNAVKVVFDSFSTLPFFDRGLNHAGRCDK